MAVLRGNKPESLSLEEIQVWQTKDKFRRKVEEICLRDENNDLEAKFWIVAPDRETNTKLADFKSANTSLGKINDLLVNSCTLAGDFECLEWNDPIYYALTKAISEKVESAKKI